ncbi:arylsulfatase A-like enzyme [Dyadobacter jejuensis]|uniref:Arylsulfatase A-like enzyme n=1 Tax=Dyadobacter jejuensis TaxID=1082580 RepID=A0A316AIZ7_9BACT|nr:arylsulfatase [Dyadobacter jejuensis]PWJ57611.1 arylsulfatase A-like enzyme [Dyadobacter jejuensis]
MRLSKLILFCWSISLATAYAQKSPNVVYILCDDLGYGDVQFLNKERGKIPTPHIDQLAQQSMTFTDAHSGSSVCTPTRYGVLTGRYAWRSELQAGVLLGGKEFSPLIDQDRLTVPSLLARANYHSAAIGKWHLGFHFVDENGDSLSVKNKNFSSGVPMGTRVPDGPITRGFDYYYGFHHAASMSTLIENDKVVAEVAPVEMLDLLSKRACTYITERAQSTEPFFLYLALNSPHSPIVPSAKWQGKSGVGSYGDYVMQTDDVLGQVMDALAKNGLDENTLVIFTSDNGCSYPAANGKKLVNEYGHYPSAQFRGYKSDIWEGGHRVPFIVRWTGTIKAGTVNTQTICATNLMATCAEITGLKIPDDAGEDSYSMWPLLIGKKVKSTAPIVSHSINGMFSIRDGKWKLELCPGSGGWSNPTDAAAQKKDLPEIQLYNILADEGEQHNVYQENPAVVAKLTKKLMKIIDDGRSTPGSRRSNDVPIDVYKKGLTENTTEKH